MNRILSGFSGCGGKDNSKLIDNFFLKLKIVLLHDTELPLLGIYPKKPKELVQKYIGTPMFTETLFTIVKILRTSQCSFIS